jgi:hypothetical protein
MIEHDSCKQLELALQIVKRELSAVERLVIKNLRGSQKEFYDFSVYLEDIYPSLFQHELYEGILFEAFLFTRIEKAREYSQSLLYGDLYAQFVMRSVDP